MLLTCGEVPQVENLRITGGIWDSRVRSIMIAASRSFAH